MPPVSSGLKKRVRAKLSILAKLQGVLAASRRERRSEDEEEDEEEEAKEVEVVRETPDVWAESFETLISDFKGRNAFTEFLRKEYSEENINFWTACCNYAYIADVSARKKQASEIYAKYLGEGATEPINIDSLARNQVINDLDKAPTNIFDSAKNQIYALMKTDSYRRFLKSDLSKLPVEKDVTSQSMAQADLGMKYGCNASDRSLSDMTRRHSPEASASYSRLNNAGEGSSATRDPRLKLQGRPPCLGGHLDTNALLANIQSNTADFPITESALHNGEQLEFQDIPEIVSPLLDNSDEETKHEDDTSDHQRLSRSKSDHETCPPRHQTLAVRNTLPRSQQPNSSLEQDCCGLVHNRLSASTPNNGDKSLFYGILSSDSESSDEEVLNGGSKSFYLLRRLSHSLDHMIELEQAGIHSSDLDAICELNDKMEYEALPSVEIERFLTSAESFTCHSTCSCGECLRLKEKTARESLDCSTAHTIPANHDTSDEQGTIAADIDIANDIRMNLPCVTNGCTTDVANGITSTTKANQTGVTDNSNNYIDSLPSMSTDCQSIDNVGM